MVKLQYKEETMDQGIEELAWEMSKDWKEKGYKDRETCAADMVQIIEEEQDRFNHREAQEEY
ncbi:hypothetical protein [uncultured Acidaminococcus sp.]|uniref:hypothetical protein n=2 Tax=Acidaminococcaceae TaxID=909930 RepID=UPI002590409D|nr:hypothetical protein [uncultured Acidaminococcus sp.]